MAYYEYKCPLYDETSHERVGFYPLLATLKRGGGHVISAQFPMGKAPLELPCDEHGVFASRVFDFQFQQDNRRLRKGVSPVTGMPYAESRREERLIEKALGIEFTGPADMPKQWKEASAYKTHVDQGGEQLPMGQVITPEAIESRPLTSYMDEAGYKKSEATPDPTPEHQQQQLQKIVEASV